MLTRFFLQLVNGHWRVSEGVSLKDDISYADFNDEAGKIFEDIGGMGALVATVSEVMLSMVVSKGASVFFIFL